MNGNSAVRYRTAVSLPIPLLPNYGQAKSETSSLAYLELRSLLWRSVLAMMSTFRRIQEKCPGYYLKRNFVR